MKKRTEIFIQNPKKYEILCDICGGNNIEWSEFEHKIWCYVCKKDTDGTGGVFDGPIAMTGLEVLGVCFDKIDLKTGERLYIKCEKDRVVWEKK